MLAGLIIIGAFVCVMAVVIFVLACIDLLLGAYYVSPRRKK